MRTSPFEEIAENCCRVFLGWRLREDREALLAMGEGRLEIDLLTGEAWCDDEPIPQLFIACAVRDNLLRELEDNALDASSLESARVDAAFARRDVRKHGETKPALQATCRVVLRAGAKEFSAEMHNR